MNFIFANLNTIILAVWGAFFIIVVVRTMRPAFVKNVSYKWLILGAVDIHLLYGAFLTWGQFMVWSAPSNDLGNMFLASPLPSETPFPFVLEWMRPFFGGTHGYFIFYSFQHFFLSTIALLIVVGLFYFFLIARAHYRSFNFREGDIMLIVLAMLISGWPGVIVLLPIGLVCAVLLSVGARFLYGVERIPLPPAFLLAAPFAFFFAIPILTALSLYPLLKL